MSRTRLAVAAATILCALMLPSVASAQTATPLTEKVAVTGTKGFKGTYTIDRFIARGDKLYAVGTLKGKLRGKNVTKRNVRHAGDAGPERRSPRRSRRCRPPARSSTSRSRRSTSTCSASRSAPTRSTSASRRCPAPGNLLGNLLCGITNLLNPGSSPLDQIAAALNAILALIRG